ncbi:hypothetical protein BJ878DRAFT_506619 [Calycina marina]|uniref:Uncharacterized protein n=1 Tax=Calycina marina TaxID=1763456 RepID=A0A9P8CEQ3_9HELO|nr:hypothetical protein BJ878DRAFT_506619 [Calycina marina]
MPVLQSFMIWSRRLGLFLLTRVLIMRWITSLAIQLTIFSSSSISSTSPLPGLMNSAAVDTCLMAPPTYSRRIPSVTVSSNCSRP